MHLILCVKINRAIIGLVRGVKDYGQFFPQKEGEGMFIKRHHIYQFQKWGNGTDLYSMTQDNTFGYFVAIVL
mgnify:CR=1 FL=1